MWLLPDLHSAGSGTQFRRSAFADTWRNAKTLGRWRRESSVWAIAFRVTARKRIEQRGDFPHQISILGSGHFLWSVRHFGWNDRAPSSCKINWPGHSPSLALSTRHLRNLRNSCDVRSALHSRDTQHQIGRPRRSGSLRRGKDGHGKPQTPNQDSWCMVGKADNGSFSLVAQFRFCRSRHLESAVCNRGIVRLFESKRDRAEIGFAPVRLRRHSCGDRGALTCRSQPSVAYSRTTCQTAFSVSLSPQVFPILCTRRNNLPDVMFAAWIHWSTTFFTHPGIGIVRVWPAFPFMSTMAQCSSRR
jgi:hypothetical protein